MYLWTLLTGEPGDVPAMLGITDDLARARRVAEPYLESGPAQVCYIEQVRFAMTSADMCSCYAYTGRYWSGTRKGDGGVAWSEHWGLRERGGPRQHGGLREHGGTRGRRGTACPPREPDAPGWGYATTDLH